MEPRSSRRDIDLTDAGFLPRQVPIDAYGNGGFRFGDMSHRGSLLCLPSGMRSWAVETASDITAASLAAVFEEADRIDVLLVGLGADISAIDPALRARLRAEGIIVEAIATGGAVRTYNVLLGEKRSIAAAFIAVAQATR
jgi:uncharacterized protein